MKRHLTQTIRAAFTLTAALAFTDAVAAQTAAGTQSGPAGSTTPSADRTDELHATGRRESRHRQSPIGRSVGQTKESAWPAREPSAAPIKALALHAGCSTSRSGIFSADSAGIPGRNMFSRQAPPQNMGAIIGPPPSGPLPNVQDNSLIVAPNAAALSSIQPNGVRPGTAGSTAESRSTTCIARLSRMVFPRQPDQGFGLLFDDRRCMIAQTNSLHVRQIDPTSIAAHAGLRLDDNVLAIDGRQFSSPQDALTYLDARLAANADTAITVVRDGQQIDLKASPTAAAAALGLRTRAVAGLGGRAGRVRAVRRGLRRPCPRNEPRRRSARLGGRDRRTAAQ